jgi:outer membrane protein insertion porin family
VDLIFTVKEKRTGSLNFGASMGQGGVGFGGFIGVEQPNLFGQCKRGRSTGSTVASSTTSRSRTRTRRCAARARRARSVRIARSPASSSGNLGQNIRTGAKFRLGIPGAVVVQLGVVRHVRW